MNFEEDEVTSQQERNNILLSPDKDSKKQDTFLYGCVACNPNNSTDPLIKLLQENCLYCGDEYNSKVASEEMVDSSIGNIFQTPEKIRKQGFGVVRLKVNHNLYLDEIKYNLIMGKELQEERQKYLPLNKNNNGDSELIKPKE
uniref:Spt4 domain-containing protein n=1 Tax=Rhabditophanes sp. KR3021 TaxID=114890 RepID=A0AC35UH24_9BILA